MSGQTLSQAFKSSLGNTAHAPEQKLQPASYAFRSLKLNAKQSEMKPFPNGANECASLYY